MLDYSGGQVTGPFKHSNGPQIPYDREFLTVEELAASEQELCLLDLVTDLSNHNFAQYKMNHFKCTEKNFVYRTYLVTGSYKCYSNCERLKLI